MRRRLGLLTRALLILVGVSPWLPQLVRGIPGLSSFGEGLEAWFGFQCHRQPERSLFVDTSQLPVCARCLGIYSGLGLGALVLWPRLRAPVLRLLVAGAALVMLLDVATELLMMRPAAAWVRVATGVLLSWPIAVQLVLWAGSYATRTHR